MPSTIELPEDRICAFIEALQRAGVDYVEQWGAILTIIDLRDVLNELDAARVEIENLERKN